MHSQRNSSIPRGMYSSRRQDDSQFHHHTTPIVPGTRYILYKHHKGHSLHTLHRVHITPTPQNTLRTCTRTCDTHVRQNLQLLILQLTSRRQLSLRFVNKNYLVYTRLHFGTWLAINTNRVASWGATQAFIRAAQGIHKKKALETEEEGITSSHRPRSRRGRTEQPLAQVYHGVFDKLSTNEYTGHERGTNHSCAHCTTKPSSAVDPDPYNLSLLRQLSLRCI